MQMNKNIQAHNIVAMTVNKQLEIHLFMSQTLIHLCNQNVSSFLSGPLEGAIKDR